MPVNLQKNKQLKKNLFNEKKKIERKSVCTRAHDSAQNEPTRFSTWVTKNYLGTSVNQKLFTMFEETYVSTSVLCLKLECHDSLEHLTMCLLERQYLLYNTLYTQKIPEHYHWHYLTICIIKEHTSYDIHVKIWCTMQSTPLIVEQQI